MGDSGQVVSQALRRANPRPAHRSVSAGVVIAAASRPHPGETANGDAWRMDRWQSWTRVTVVDGLGHGPAAAAASEAALRALAERPDLGPAEALSRCHDALRGTRGAAVSIASIDPKGGRLQFAGVGNVEGVLWQAGGREQLLTRRGIVGGTLPSVRMYEHALDGTWAIILHTDGVSQRFVAMDLPELQQRDQAHPLDPQALADRIMREWGRSTDDATVVVIAGNDLKRNRHGEQGHGAERRAGMNDGSGDAA
jgi:serine phosphatase RsbU (regulator of sigma subunit)